VHMIIRQILEGRCEVENQYKRVVHDDGNPKALEVLARTGTAEQKDRARALLSRIADRESVGNEPEAARLLGWLEGARERLAWDEEKARWVERDFK